MLAEELIGSRVASHRSTPVLKFTARRRGVLCRLAPPGSPRRSGYRVRRSLQAAPTIARGGADLADQSLLVSSATTSAAAAYGLAFWTF